MPSLTSIYRAYRQRLVRKVWQLRAAVKGRRLNRVQLRAEGGRKGAIYLFCVLHNESLRLPYFLDYYRRLGVEHFFLIDNASTDGSAEFLQQQADVSLWSASGSYRAAHFGMDWMNHLLSRFGRDNWCLTVDCDELLVYPYCDARPLRALTDWLESAGLNAMPAMLLDMFPQGALGAQTYCAGDNPTTVLTHYDAANYVYRRENGHKHLWIQGGPRMRLNFADRPEQAPALNKLPLVKWRWGYVYVSSTHLILPRKMNITYDDTGGEMIAGCLLHTKFLPDIITRAAEENHRQQHYAGGMEYHAYGNTLAGETVLWSPQASRYAGWQQLQDDGLISSGGWA